MCFIWILLKSDFNVAVFLSCFGCDIFFIPGLMLFSNFLLLSLPAPALASSTAAHSSDLTPHCPLGTFLTPPSRSAPFVTSSRSTVAFPSRTLLSGAPVPLALQCFSLVPDGLWVPGSEATAGWSPPHPTQKIVSSILPLACFHFIMTIISSDISPQSSIMHRCL